jgi:5-methylcytosine-specific restriction endonuclease McrA
MNRVCPKCQESKPLTTEYFYKNKSEVGGFQYTCKICHKQYYKRKNNQKWYKPEVNRAYKKKRYKEDIEFRLQIQLRNRINQYLKKGDKEKTIDFLGCSITEWKSYLEEQFSPNMNWGNHGIYWEIDHIKPLSKGGSFHYQNTQPLTIPANRSKSNKYEKLSEFNS